LLYRWHRDLFKFNTNLEEEYKKKLKILKPNRETKLICAQIRVGGERDDYNKREFMRKENVKQFWDFIRKNLTNDKAILKDYKLFVTTDTPELIDEAANIFGQDKVVGFKNISFHIHSNSEGKKCSDFIGIAVDFYLLAHCDMGVVSQSGFGLMGILNRKVKNLNKFYVYTSPSELRKSFWERSKASLSFHPFDYSLLYLLFN
jgi:hypothetical protein